MATFLDGAYRSLVANRNSREKGGQRVYWYNWASVYCCEVFRFTGLMAYDNRERVSPKPAHEAYLQSARKYQGCYKLSNGQCLGAPQ